MTRRRVVERRENLQVYCSRLWDILNCADCLPGHASIPVSKFSTSSPPSLFLYFSCTLEDFEFF